MRAQSWKSGKAPHKGWWLCSGGWWRWFDGEYWRHGVKEGASIKTIINSSYRKCPIECQSIISWCDYWPENARVPRINPNKE